MALALTAVVFAAALVMAIPAASGFRALPEHADVQQRLRTAVDALRSDVQAAASRPAVGLDIIGASGWPAVRPCGWERDPVSGLPSPCARVDVIALATFDRPLQVVTAAPASGHDPIAILRPAGCPPGAEGCQFNPGDRVIVTDGCGAADSVEVERVSADGTVLGHAVALSTAYPAGAAVVSARIRTYYARPDPATGMLQLRRIDGGSDLPLLDHLTEFSLEYFGEADPPRPMPGGEGPDAVTYGPRPLRARLPGRDGAGAPVASCAFDILDGAPVSRLLPLPVDADGLARLPLSMLRDGPWCPDATAPSRFDVDLFRVRRLRITLRTEAAPDDARGRDPVLFARPGSGSSALRLVPGLGVRFDLALRGAD